jgi:hypothetical protein
MHGADAVYVQFLGHFAQPSAQVLNIPLHLLYVEHVAEVYFKVL